MERWELSLEGSTRRAVERPVTNEFVNTLKEGRAERERNPSSESGPPTRPSSLAFSGVALTTGDRLDLFHAAPPWQNPFTLASSLHLTLGAVFRMLCSSALTPSLVQVVSTYFSFLTFGITLVAGT